MTFLAVAVLAAEEGGFNPLDPAQGGIALWTWIIFFVSLPFIWKVVMGPVSRALTARDEAASRAIVQAEEASRQAQEAQAAVERSLAEAQREAQATIEAARARAEAREREMLAAAEQKSVALLERARGEIQAEQDKAVATIRRQVVELSLSAASQVLRRKVDAQDDRRLVEELVAGSQGAVQQGKRT